MFRRFDVVSASFDSGTGRLTLQTSTEDPPLNTFTPSGGPSASLSPSFFRIRTEGTLDSLPPTASVRIRFQATEAAAGQPDLTKALPPDPSGQAAIWATDPAALNVPGNENLRFFRFEVRFDIARGYYMYRDKFAFAAEPVQGLDVENLGASNIGPG